MIVLDTNIISELMKPEPHTGMRHWVNAQELEHLYLTSVSWYELLYGLELMPSGKRRDGLGQTLNALRSELFADRVLPFDEKAARGLSKLMAQARRDGIAISLGDGEVAAIASQHGFAVATRDVAPFKAAGLKVINPW